jgi:nicotinamidase-related amidase
VTRAEGRGDRALLVVDVQHEPLLRVPGLQPVADAIVDHVRTHRAAYGLVVATRFRSRAGSTYHRLIADDLRDPDEVRLAPGIEEHADMVVESTTYSSLTTDVRNLLTGLAPREVHVVGLDTDQCVLATVLALFDAGFQPIVLADLCASASGARPHEAGLLVLRRAIGEDRVVTSRIVVEAT